jgi:hypothetical protein
MTAFLSAQVCLASSSSRVASASFVRCSSCNFAPRNSIASFRVVYHVSSASELICRHSSVGASEVSLESISWDSPSRRERNSSATFAFSFRESASRESAVVNSTTQSTKS